MSHSEYLACPSCRRVLAAFGKEYRCDACNKAFPCVEGKVFFADVPTNYEGSGITSTHDARTWSEWRKKNFLFYQEELSGISGNARVLDFGVGPAQFSSLTKRFTEVVGADFRPFEPVAVVADLTKPLPLKDNSFDVVISSNTFEHLPNTEEVLREVHRVLKPGGVMLATVPFLMRIHQKPYDFNRYTFYKWEWLCARTGFSAHRVSALSVPQDVYRTVQRHFYTHLISDSRSIQGPWRIPVLFAAKVLWKLDQYKLRLFGWVYRRATVSGDFTEGYAIVAYK